MKTFLAQNQFITDSVTPPSPAVTHTAAADQVAPQVAAAGTSSCSATDAHLSHDDVMCGKPSGRKPDLGIATELQGTAVIDSCQEPVAADPTNHIHEIFFYVRKLMKQPPAFVLDEARFLADVEEVPLFIREDGYLKRQA